MLFILMRESGLTALDVVIMGGETGHKDTATDIARLLTKHVDLEDPFFDYQNRERNYGHNMLPWILSYTESEYYKQTVQKRVLFIISLCSRFGQCHIPSLMVQLLGTELYTTEACSVVNMWQQNLLHCIMWNSGWLGNLNPERDMSSIMCRLQVSTGDMASIDDEMLGDELQSLLVMIRQLISSGSGLHNTAVRELGYRGKWLGQTPLVAIVSAYTDCNKMLDYGMGPWEKTSRRVIKPPGDNRGPGHRRPLRALRMLLLLWLILLDDCGVNLMSYGREEKRLHTSGKAKTRCTLTRRTKVCGGWDTQYQEYYLHFTYGRTPADWQFWFFEKITRDFLDFWNMVGRNDPTGNLVPGAWDASYDFNGDEEHLGFTDSDNDVVDE